MKEKLQKLVEGADNQYFQTIEYAANQGLLSSGLYKFLKKNKIGLAVGNGGWFFYKHDHKTGKNYDVEELIPPKMIDWMEIPVTRQFMLGEFCKNVEID